MNLTINNISATRPSFGMAYKFREGGAERMAKAFYDAPEVAKNLVKAGKKNPDVEVIVDKSNIEVKPKRYADELAEFIRGEQSKKLHENSTENPFKSIGQGAFIDKEAMEKRKKPFLNASDLSNEVQKLITELDELYKGEDTVKAAAKELEDIALKPQVSI